MKTKESKLEKIILIIAILIIVAGVVTINTVGFNIGIDYAKSKNIKIHFDDSYNMSDINNIANDVFGNEYKKVQEIEYFNNDVLITVKTISDEQISSLKEKVSENYNIEDIDEHIDVNDIPEYHFKDIVKPYVTPLVITTIAIFVYLGVRFRKLGVKKAILIPLGILTILELLYVSVIAISRIPFGRFIIPVSLVIYIITMILSVIRLSKIEESVKSEEKVRNK